jgi:hypothetical protein
MLMVNGYYVGQFTCNQRHGQGKYVWHSGDVYEGEWVTGLRNGFARMYSKAHDQYYEGYFKNNKKHGDGSLIASNGETVI